MYNRIVSSRRQPATWDEWPICVWYIFFVKSKSHRGLHNFWGWPDKSHLLIQGIQVILRVHSPNFLVILYLYLGFDLFIFNYLNVGNKTFCHICLYTPKAIPFDYIIWFNGFEYKYLKCRFHWDVKQILFSWKPL